MSAGEFVKLAVIGVSSTSFFMHGTRARSLASRVYKTFHKSTPPAAYKSHGGIPDEVNGERIEEAADETGDFAAASMVSCKMLDWRATIAVSCLIHTHAALHCDELLLMIGATVAANCESKPASACWPCWGVIVPLPT